MRMRGSEHSTVRYSVATTQPDEPADFELPDVPHDVDAAPRGRGARADRASRAAHLAELAGAVRIRHDGREYAAWYRVVDDLLTVYCGLASNTGLLPHPSPSPKPLAERLLRELIDAEHPGLNPE